jgi:hypothetical protein
MRFLFFSIIVLGFLGCTANAKIHNLQVSKEVNTPIHNILVQMHVTPYTRVPMADIYRELRFQCWDRGLTIHGTIASDKPRDIRRVDSLMQVYKPDAVLHIYDSLDMRKAPVKKIREQFMRTKRPNQLAYVLMDPTSESVRWGCTMSINDGWNMRLAFGDRFLGSAPIKLAEQLVAEWQTYGWIPAPLIPKPAYPIDWSKGKPQNGM